ncbi:MAG: peptidylprolyl isomerase [Melioribacteraceae bacterium]|nr:peptidylprolyl isomerase [Melioribacteraceae bacterium]
MKTKIYLQVIIATLLLVNITIAQTGKPQYVIRTEQNGVDFGTFTIELFPQIAPLHSAYFDSLVNISFFDSTAFHRVIPDFVIQGGDPNSKHLPRNTWGEGDTSQATIPAEFSAVSHLRSIIGAARDTDINSASSQFYVNVGDNGFLDSNYTAFGRVISGMDIVDLIVSVPRDANDNPNDKIEMFITKGGSTNIVPTVPLLTYPANMGIGLIVGDTLRWESDEDAVLFSLQISTNQNFDSLYLNTNVGRDFHRLSFLELGNIKYYWRVKASNGGNVSEYSTPQVFYSSITAPILIAPVMNEDSVSVTPKLEWQPVDGATGYKVLVSRAPQFYDRYIVVNVDTITITSFVTPELQETKSHYWKVYSLTDEYVGPSSGFSRFVTWSLTSIKSADKFLHKYSLAQNYPNPFNPSTTIEFSIPKVSQVTLEVFDIKGERVSQLLNEELNAGTYQFKFDGSQLSSGLYFYKIIVSTFPQNKYISSSATASFVEVKKMLLIK